MIHSELRTEVQTMANNDTTTASSANVKTWLNLTKNHIEKKLRHRVTREEGAFATEVDVAEYVIISTAFRSFIQFWQTATPTQLTEVDYKKFVRIFPDPATSGPPRFWMFKGFASGFPLIQVYPIPDDTYTISYEILTRTADFDGDTDEWILSEYGYDELLIQGAFTRYLRVKDQQRYVLERAEYDRLLKEAISELEPSQDEKHQFENMFERDIEIPRLLMPSNFVQY